MSDPIRIPLGVGAYKRTFAQGVEIRMENRFFEQNPTVVEEASLLARPGSIAFAAEGDAPYRALFSQPGVFDGDLFIVSSDGSDGALHRYGASTVEITGADTLLDEISFAASVGLSYGNLFIAGGGDLFVYEDGAAALAAVATPGSVGISKVVSLSGFVLAVVKDSMQFFFIRPGDITIDALDYESAEAEPDKIVDAVRAGDLVWLFGESSTEAWYASGDAERPVQRMSGLAFRIGARAGTVALVQETPYFVGSDDVVYALDGRPRRVSDHGIEERIRLNRDSFFGTGEKAWSFHFDGHFFYALTLEGQGTFIYDATTQQWGRWITFPTTLWNLVQGAQWGVRTIGIDWDGGEISELRADVTTDPGEEPIVSVVTGVYPHRARNVARNSYARVYGSALPSVVEDPSVVLSVSDDNGATWTDFTKELGASPSQELYFQSLGRVGSPGRVFSLSDTGALVRIDGLYAQID
jgi:hypothetical protein